MLLHSESTEEREGETAEPWRSEWSEVHRRLRVYGPPLPFGLAPEARQAMIRERIAMIFEGLSVAAGSAAVAGPEAARPSGDGAPAALP
jgi:hypothetical protein